MLHPIHQTKASIWHDNNRLRAVMTDVSVEPLIYIAFKTLIICIDKLVEPIRYWLSDISFS